MDFQKFNINHNIALEEYKKIKVIIDNKSNRQSLLKNIDLIYNKEKRIFKSDIPFFVYLYLMESVFDDRFPYQYNGIPLSLIVSSYLQEAKNKNWLNALDCLNAVGYYTWKKDLTNTYSLFYSDEWTTQYIRATRNKDATWYSKLFEALFNTSSFKNDISIKNHMRLVCEAIDYTINTYPNSLYFTLLTENKFDENIHLEFGPEKLKTRIEFIQIPFEYRITVANTSFTLSETLIDSIPELCKLFKFLLFKNIICHTIKFVKPKNLSLFTSRTKKMYMLNVFKESRRTCG